MSEGSGNFGEEGAEVMLDGGVAVELPAPTTVSLTFTYEFNDRVTDMKDLAVVRRSWVPSDHASQRGWDILRTMSNPIEEAAGEGEAEASIGAEDQEYWRRTGSAWLNTGGCAISKLA